MLAGNASDAKGRLIDAYRWVATRFAEIIEFMWLANAGAKAIGDGAYSLPALSRPETFPSHVRDILLSHSRELRVASMLCAADASALVLAHAVLDESATECCRIIALADPEAWRDMIINKQVPLSDLEAISFQEVYHRLLGEIYRFAREGEIAEGAHKSSPRKMLAAAA